MSEQAVMQQKAVNAVRLGIVVIGRNEAPRLRATLDAVRSAGATVVYVDSNSTDGSPDIATEMGVDTLRITEGQLTAARGRRTGMEQLLSDEPGLEYIQFIDGDCELSPGWIEDAVEFLEANPQAGAVAGRLRERRADESLLVRLVDVEWDLPVGRIDVVGGISMMRVEALRKAGGWSDGLIAGEELDLSMRMKEAGFTLHRLERDMCLHDIGITRLSEFWRRSVRTGFAYAQLAWTHGRTGPRRWTTRTIGAAVYGFGLPILLIAGVFTHWSVSAVGAVGYAILIARVALWRRGRGDPWRVAIAYGAIIALCKTAHAIGAVRFLLARIAGRPGAIIEYKTPAATRTD
ncbi:MAG: glycosyltransferase family 2 protein [Phycisphaeraceae bacterium]|nr:MAG: glycosyltransferase family 2 protein [Phycisphaeraceae bacterium]